MRIIAEELPIHGDELPSIGVVVGMVAFLLVTVAPLSAALAPGGGRGGVDDAARGLVRRGTVHVCCSSCGSDVIARNYIRATASTAGGARGALREAVSRPDAVRSRR